MNYLNVTLIDVGWGDSILIEASDPNPAAPRPRFALIDSNDNADRSYWPTWNFLRKHFGIREKEFKVTKPFFDFVMLTHDHSDHGTGLKRIMQEYGTLNFWYPKVKEDESVIVASLHAYVNYAGIVHQAVDSNYIPGCLGDVDMDFLWPPPDTIDSDPNNNSIVLTLSLNGKTIVLTGDAEGKVWQKIVDQIHPGTCAFKVPHHGSRNGTIYNNTFPWLDKLDLFPVAPYLAISCHPTFPNRFGFPHDEVIAKFKQRPYSWYETDLHYHITLSISQNTFTAKYSH
jgi:beta-lactamase superfamily II metal-dependent hydrolase